MMSEFWTSTRTHTSGTSPANKVQKKSSKRNVPIKVELESVSTANIRARDHSLMWSDTDMIRLTQKALSAFVSTVLITSYLIHGKDQQSLKCGPGPDTPELHRFLPSSPIVIHARIQEMIPTQEGHEFDLIVLITQIVIKPNDVDIPKRVVLRRFFLPFNESTTTSSNPNSDRFGCLESFKPYTKYTFLLENTGEVILHRGFQLSVLSLSGPALSFSEKVNQDIQRFLCKTCYPPKLNKFEKTTKDFGDKVVATCTADGNPLPEVYWYKDNYPVDVVTNGYSVSVDVVQTGPYVVQAILEVDNLILLDNGDYICKAKNSLGISQSVLQLRVRKPEIPEIAEEHVMDNRDLEPCDPEENHCFNDGQCFFRKSNPSDRRCSCTEGYMGDQCQFRTTGILFSASPSKTPNFFWLQVILQFAFIAVFGLIIIGIILAFRRKDLRSKQKRKILMKPGVLFKSRYVQVNTIESIPTKIKSQNDASGINEATSPPKAKFSSVIPRTPHYARLKSNEFTFDDYTAKGNGALLNESSAQVNRMRMTTPPQPQRDGFSVGLLEPIAESEPESSPKETWNDEYV
ncbi:hypothetical protein Aperf_G00000116169 [Anoplocephala perfoliata]